MNFVGYEKEVNGVEWFKQINGERMFEKMLIGKKFPMTVRALCLVII